MKNRKTSLYALNHLSVQLLLILVVVFSVFPWVYVTQDVRPYRFHAENFLQFKYLLAYLKKFPEFFPGPVVLLIFLGTGVTLWKKRLSGFVALVVFIALYILFTADDPYWLPVDRFAVLFIPFCAVLVSQVHLLIPSAKWKQWVFTLSVLSVCLLGLDGWATDNTRFGMLAKNTPTVSNYPHYPFKELLFSLKNHGVRKGNVLFPAYWQTAFPAYCRMYQIWGYKEVMPPWTARGKRGTTIQELADFCRDKECTALIVPFVYQNDTTVKVKWVQNIDFDSIQSNNIPGFSVLDTYHGRQRGLVLLTPGNN